VPKMRRSPAPPPSAARRTIAPPPTDPIHAARTAGLRYVSDGGPGIRRLSSGRGFRYVGPDGKAVRDAEALARIRSLAIPPAWTDVWICPRADGHLQATGRDARGRKQYRYHPRWREVRDGTKYDRMVAFALALPRLRARIDEDLRRRGLPREKVLAAVVRLLETTHIRVGNDEYAKQNGSYGLTTLRDRHADIDGATVRFRFRGKSGVRHDVALTDRRLARVVGRCQELPGQELFQYVDDDGQVRDVTSADVNDYLRDMTGQEFTAKDFRTWAATVLAAHTLVGFEAASSQTEAKRKIVAAVAAVAERLGNSKAVCRKCYIHPAVFDAYLDGSLAGAIGTVRVEETTEVTVELRPEETAVLKFLQSRSVSLKSA
jgi:DNA topoisomerase I